MGDHEGWAQPSGLLLNGLLPNQGASVTQVLDAERWSKAEERTAELIACIQPNPSSEARRNAVAVYVRSLMMKCFSCEVFTFGSVPLKTYLPDGDIDLTAFSNDQNMKDTWAQEVRDMLENEEKSENAEFRVKEVQYIQAEVKIIKCLVENIVVDISFNQLGGLCTLCFLEEVDLLINQNHLFKRSIILIKAWCYYESRILGAHHGLISTYALETLVLYIFHVFNNSFSGPLEVLYRFLAFFSNFDWDNFCVSLWGPVPISSLPNMTAEPPRMDSGELLLSKRFLDECSSSYAVFPGGQENHFVSKHFNVIDPLRTNNNLGRSVSKGNFFRIRSAFAFGAKKLARLLECPKEKIIAEVNQFFMDTWERHGSGNRPDAPTPDLWPLRPSNREPVISKSLSNHSGNKKKGEDVRSAGREFHDAGAPAFHGNIAQSVNTLAHASESMSKIANVPVVSHAQSQKIYGSQSGLKVQEQIARHLRTSETTMRTEKSHKSTQPDELVNEYGGQGRLHFARTQSSPALTDTSREVMSRVRRNRASDTARNQSASVRPDPVNRKKTYSSEVSTSQSTRSSTDDPSFLRQSPSYQSPDAATDSNSVTNSYHDESGLGTVGEDLVSVAEIMEMHQEEQDLVNMMASSRANNFNGQIQLPLNLASHLSLPRSPVFPSMGYNQRNMVGTLPANIPLIEHPWGSNMPLHQGFTSSPLPHYFHSVGLASSPAEMIDSGHSNSVVTDLNQDDGDVFWQEQDAACTRGYDDPDNESFQSLQSVDKKNVTPGEFDFMSSRVSNSGGSFIRDQSKFVRENKGLPKEDHNDTFQYQYRRNDVHNAERNLNSRVAPVAQASSSRSKMASESSWDGSSSSKSSKSRDKKGRKATPPSFSFAYGQAKSAQEYEEVSSDNVSSQADDGIRDWIPLSTMGSEVGTENAEPASLSPPHLQNHQLPVYKTAQISGSESLIPISPMLVNASSRQRPMDGSGMLAFYPTGPPVPFVTMVPMYNFPHESGNSDASSSHFDRDEDGLDRSHTNRLELNFDAAGSVDQSGNFSSSSSIKGASVEIPEERNSDILNGDFVSHLRNLKYGRLCQSPRYHEPLIYPPSVVVPPVYLQGHFPLDAPGRPLPANVNLFTQLMSYGSRLVPVTPLQPGSSRPAGVYQRYGDEVPRYRGGTGTYLPNPKASFRDRQSSTRNHRGNYNYDRSDHGDNERNWNNNSKSRGAGRGHGRGQGEKPRARSERMMATDGLADRQWDSYRHESVTSFQVQNGSFGSGNAMHSSSNMAYGVYPLPAVNSNGVATAGPAVPSLVMLYPYDQNAGYVSPSEQLEFGSLGPVHLSSTTESSQLGDGSLARGVHPQRHSTYQGGDSACSSPDESSSPQRQRGL